jgi:membrane protein insertase Oxa1/YidC/SpoIIIJ
VWIKFREIRAEPYFNNIILIDTNTILVYFKMAYLFGKTMKAMKTLVIEMKNIRKRYKYYVGETKRNTLSEDTATI